MSIVMNLNIQITSIIYIFLNSMGDAWENYVNRYEPGNYANHYELEHSNLQSQKFHELCIFYTLKWWSCEQESVYYTYRRWAGKTSYVHLAPEHEYRTKHVMKAHKN